MPNFNLKQTKLCGELLRFLGTDVAICSGSTVTIISQNSSKTTKISTRIGNIKFIEKLQESLVVGDEDGNLVLISNSFIQSRVCLESTILGICAHGDGLLVSAANELILLTKHLIYVKSIFVKSSIVLMATLDKGQTVAVNAKNELYLLSESLEFVQNLDVKGRITTLTTDSSEIYFATDLGFIYHLSGDQIHKIHYVDHEITKIGFQKGSMLVIGHFAAIKHQQTEEKSFIDIETNDWVTDFDAKEEIVFSCQNVNFLTFPAAR